ncbi:MAG: hypothetical protein KDE19_16960 [Caldilineaceae bacterium]|nr:hypothetical protein [Caldilineaceae bacterium]
MADTRTTENERRVGTDVSPRDGVEVFDADKTGDTATSATGTDPHTRNSDRTDTRVTAGTPNRGSNWSMWITAAVIILIIILLLVWLF